MLSPDMHLCKKIIKAVQFIPDSRLHTMFMYTTGTFPLNYYNTTVLTHKNQLNIVGYNIPSLS